MGAVKDRARRNLVESVAIAEEAASPLRHDLRNKFASIRNATAYIERSLGKLSLLDRDPRIQRFLKLICEELDVANALLDERASYTRLLSDEAVEVRLGACALEAIARTRPPEGVEIAGDVPIDPAVRGDFEELALALQCLLENALEASSPGDLVRVEVGAAAGHVFLGVYDAGPGIAPEARERALTPFVSDKPGHAGLGLNVALRLAARNGARLTLEPGPDTRGLSARLVFEGDE